MGSSWMLDVGIVYTISFTSIFQSEVEFFYSREFLPEPEIEDCRHSVLMLSPGSIN